MREILFRGKNQQGEWLYGNYCGVEYFEGDGIEHLIIEIPRNGFSAPVIPETVGQYTGLTAKNGKKIFEGDIIVIDHAIKTHSWEEIPETYKPRRSHSLFYDDIKDHLTYKRNYAVEWKLKRARWILRNGSDQHELTDAYLFYHNGIIIGNIHDNPELLKGE